MDHAELKTKGAAELKELLKKEQADLHKANLSARAKELKQVHAIGQHKKTIARIKLLLNQA